MNKIEQVSRTQGESESDYIYTIKYEVTKFIKFANFELLGKNLWSNGESGKEKNSWSLVNNINEDEKMAP